MTRSPKVKSKASVWPVPQSRDEVVTAITRIGVLQRDRDRLQSDMNDQIAAIKERFEEAARPAAEEIKGLSSGVQIWCEAHRDELTAAGKTKTVTMGSGEVRWRMTPPKVTLRAVDMVIQLLKEKGLARFLRTKEEVSKEAILADQDAVEGIAGISITQGEEFVIVPFETKLEEVA